MRRAAQLARRDTARRDVYARGRGNARPPATISINPERLNLLLQIIERLSPPPAPPRPARCLVDGPAGLRIEQEIAELRDSSIGRVFDHKGCYRLLHNGRPIGAAEEADHITGEIVTILEVLFPTETRTQRETIFSAAHGVMRLFGEGKWEHV